MPAIHDVLQRFRPAGAPGPAAAVPADRRAALEEELGPVFAGLQEAEAERRQIVGEAGDRARALREAARVEAAGLVERARSEAAGERASAEAEVRHAAEDEDRALLAAAENEANRIRAVASARLDGLVARAAGFVGAYVDETRAPQ
ncbi:MAG TPA: hypothetical protein VFV01_00985 [Spirillospora sp.]|nr:hypothetical protein [Spirillospora sp.]